MPSQKIKQKDLVNIVFSRFWERAKLQNLSSLESISIEMDALREEIAAVSGTPRENNKWILTQLKKYEDKIGTKLFKKNRNQEGAEQLSIVKSLDSFLQKKHLHLSEKLRLANGLADFMSEEYVGSTLAINLFLGAGTTIALFAEILISHVEKRSFPPLHIYTNNMGVIDILKTSSNESLKLMVLGGWFDKKIYGNIPEPKDLELLPDFDITVQGASFFHEGRLYVESEREALVKKSLLNIFSGTRVLLLTLHEYQEKLSDSYNPFGHLNDYDLLIIPKVKTPSHSQEVGREWLKNHLLEPSIRQWQYEIFPCRA